VKEQALLDQEEENSEEEDSDCEDATNDYTDEDIYNIIERKLDPETVSRASQKPKAKATKAKARAAREKEYIKSRNRSKNGKSLEFSKNTIELTPKKPILSRNRSYTRKEDQEELGNSINAEAVMEMEISQYHNNFDTKATKIIESHSSIVNRILKKREKQRLLCNSKDFLDLDGYEHRNNVFYDWSIHKKEQEKSSKHFQFELPLSEENIAAAKKKEGFRASGIEQRDDRKKCSIFAVKKGLLPSLGRVEGVQ
jgi:hypothetical protein